MQGVVRSGLEGSPLANAEVKLHQAGDSFHYATASLGDGVVLMTILGASVPDRFVINELTTVAAAYSAAQFLRGASIQGDAFALSIVAAMNENLVDVATGGPSRVMTTSPNGDETNSCRTLMSLANLLHTAVRDRGKGLQALLTLTTLPGEAPPSNTVEALGNLARNPANHAGGIFVQSKLARAYEPALRDQPDAWTIVVKVNDSGDDARMFGGPGSIAFDSQGRGWIPNNVVQGTGNSADYSIVLDKSGRPARHADGRLMSPCSGGGLLGAGFGAAVDREDNAWFGDFGWGDSMPVGGASKFDSNARPLSPAPNGFTQGGMYRVQGTEVDPSGNVWFAGWGNGTVVCFRGGRPDDWAVYADTSGAFKPFGIAFAKDGSAWVANADGANSGILNIVLGRGRYMHCRRHTSIGKVLKGVQIDSAGNIWVGSGSDHHVYVFDPEGKVIGGYQGGGINGPWGIMLDGADNLWVGNFGPLEVGSVFHGRLTALAGVNAKGYLLGDALTPPTGYTLPSAGSQVLLHDGTPLYGPDGPPCFIPMTRTTGVNVDAAGNVWTCNNWKPDFNNDLVGDPLANQQPNPGGDGMLIWVGVAAPKRRLNNR